MATKQYLYSTLWLGYILLLTTSLTGRITAEVITSEHTSMFGELITPGYPESYPNDLNRVWNITAPEGYQIRLYFTVFDVEYSAECEYDFLKITSGNRKIGTYCGTKEVMTEYTPAEAILTSYPDNKLSVEFHSDFSNDEQFKGIVGHYYADDIDECAEANGGCKQRCHNYESGYFCSCRKGYELMEDQQSCIPSCQDLTYTTTSGVIQSTDYPENYPSNADCDWLIDVESGYVINFSFDVIDIEAHPTVTCPYDYVTVAADGVKHGPFCDSLPTNNPLPAPIVTSGNTLRVVFHSDSSVSQAGFRATYHLTAKPCVTINAPAYGSMEGSEFTFKSVVSFSCRNGYNLVGSEHRTCMADGNWSGDEAVCRLVDCGPPLSVRNGHILYYNLYNFTFTNDVGYKCDDLYVLEGSSFRTCQADGQWEGEEPICIPKCGEARFERRYPPRGRVVGAREAVQGSWPWQSWIIINARETQYERSDHFCGGSLLNEEWVMTAAHCVTGANSNHEGHYGMAIPSDSLRVVLGLHDVRDEDINTVSVYTDQIIIHPSYEAATYDSDIALLHLNQTIQFTDYIRPICLPSQNPSPDAPVGDEDTTVVVDSADSISSGAVIGWGRTEDGSTSSMLREVYVPVIDRETCRESTDFLVSNNMVCAGRAEGGRDSCEGDSGGPLMFQNSTTLSFYVYGIVSWGNPNCGAQGTYGVYTRVENFVDWVTSNSAMDRSTN